MEAHYFPDDVAPFLFAPIVVMLILLMTKGDAAVTVALALGSQITAMATLQPPMPLTEQLRHVLITAVSGAAATLGAHQLHSALTWANESTIAATVAAQEARLRRAELLVLNKELENACYRIERLNRMLVLARQEAEEARTLKARFANTVSHELRSPLNMIIGFSEMMLNSPDTYGMQGWPPRLQQHIRHIYESSQHLSQLVDDVLDLGRIEAFRLPLNKTRAVLDELIAEAMRIVEGHCVTRGLQMRRDIPPDLPSVSIDRVRIRQVLLNLLANAIRFSEEGEIVVQVRNAQSEVIVSVSDMGPGIADEDLHHIFQEFRQLNGSKYSWQQGSGLGLAISKQLVEMHGGRIWVESAPKQGSTFSFTIPTAAGPSDTVFLLAAREQQYWDSLETEAQRQCPIIVSAANLRLRRFVSANLTAYDITWAATGEDLDDAADDARPLAKVSIVDGWQDGYLPFGGRKPIRMPLLYCSLGDVGDVSLPFGLADYLVKPVSRDKLASALGRLGKVPARILVVDDEPSMRELLRYAVSSIYPASQVWEAESGQQAMRMARGLVPDTVLLDLGLPDVDGLDVAQQVFQCSGNAVSIIAVTARNYCDEEGVDKARALAAIHVEGIDRDQAGRLLDVILRNLSPSKALLTTGLDRAPAAGGTDAIPAVDGK
ncbi:MAG: hybrid sensor histidine kinase/response regulator [Anaerolineae bacterium]